MKKVMVVEDEEFILQGILCINDWASMDMEVVHTAHNGKEALEKFREEPVDILLTDVEMPLNEWPGVDRRNPEVKQTSALSDSVRI